MHHIYKNILTKLMIFFSIVNVVIFNSIKLIINCRILNVKLQNLNAAISYLKISLSSKSFHTLSQRLYSVMKKKRNNNRYNEKSLSVSRIASVPTSDPFQKVTTQPAVSRWQWRAIKTLCPSAKLPSKWAENGKRRGDPLIKGSRHHLF